MRGPLADEMPGSPVPLLPALAGSISKVLLVNLRHGIAAAALLSTALLTVACASPTAGTPSAGGAAVVTTSAAAASPTPSTSAVSSSSSSVSSSSAPTTTASSTAAVEDSSIADEPTLTIVVEPAALDATTAIWLQNSCTDIGTLFGALFAIPTVDENTPLEEFRYAYISYTHRSPTPCSR